MKDYEELTFADDFMFCKILQENEDLCKELTELVSEDMKHFIDFFAGKSAQGHLPSRINGKVQEAIQQRLWRKEYMTLKEMMKDEYEQGREVGIKQGIEQSIEQMLARGKTPEEIAEFCGYSLDQVKNAQGKMLHKVN